MFKTIFYFLIALVATSNFLAVKGQINERKEYQSTENQFSVTYPKNWNVQIPKDYSVDNGNRLNYGVVVLVSPVVWDDDQPNSAGISICSQPLNKELNNFDKDYCHPRDDHLSDIAKNQVISRKQIKVDGIDAERIETKVKYEDRFYYYVSFTTKTRMFFITGSFRKSSKEVFDTFKYEPEFDQIVGSLKLIDASSKK